MNTKQWFEVCKPNPTRADFNVQLGCHLEETVELLMALRLESPQLNHEMKHAAQILDFVATQLKRSIAMVETMDTRAMIEVCDACGDMRVTAAGMLHTMGIDYQAVDKEIERSNASKLVDGKPLLAETGKIMKGPHYSPPDLGQFITGKGE